LFFAEKLLSFATWNATLCVSDRHHLIA